MKHGVIRSIHTKYEQIFHSNNSNNTHTHTHTHIAHKVHTHPHTYSTHNHTHSHNHTHTAHTHTAHTHTHTHSHNHTHKSHTQHTPTKPKHNVVLYLITEWKWSQSIVKAPICVPNFQPFVKSISDKCVQLSARITTQHSNMGAFTYNLVHVYPWRHNTTNTTMVTTIINTMSPTV